MTLSKNHVLARSGFTLMEVLVVVAILVVLAGVGGVVYMNYLDEAREKTATLGVKNIEQAVQAYMVNYGDYPPNLEILTEPIGNKPAPLEQSALKDPWDRPYHYVREQRHAKTGKPLIYSDGPRPGDPTSQFSNWRDE